MQPHPCAFFIIIWYFLEATIFIYRTEGHNRSRVTLSLAHSEKGRFMGLQFPTMSFNKKIVMIQGKNRRQKKERNTGADPEIFQWGGVKRKILKEKCLLIHVSTRVRIKTSQTCNSFSLLPFQGDCLLFFALFYYSILFLKFERGIATPVTPPPFDSPMETVM